MPPGQKDNNRVKKLVSTKYVAARQQDQEENLTIKHSNTNKNMTHNKLTNGIENKSSKQEYTMLLQYRRLQHLKGCTIQLTKMYTGGYYKKSAPYN